MPLFQNKSSQLVTCPEVGENIFFLFASHASIGRQYPRLRFQRWGTDFVLCLSPLRKDNKRVAGINMGSRYILVFLRDLDTRNNIRNKLIKSNSSKHVTKKPLACDFIDKESGEINLTPPN